MKNNFLKKAISAVLAATMLVSTSQLAVVTAFAANGTKQTLHNAAKVTMTGEDIIKQELAARVPVTKDRTAINENSEAAVYKDGKIVDVKLVYKTDYVEQMLHYSKEWSFLPSIN